MLHSARKYRSRSVPDVTRRPDSTDGVRDLSFLRELRNSNKRIHGQPLTWSTPFLLSLCLLVLLVAQLFPASSFLNSTFPFGRPHDRSQTCPWPTVNPFVSDLYCYPRPTHKAGSLYGTSPQSMALAQAAARVASEFEYSKEDINRGVAEFIRQMQEGLAKDGTTMAQIPTYVTAVPNGTEKGLYMAVDLGGTNFRVCSVQLHGNSTFSLTQSKVAIPKELMVAKTSRELFAFLAKQIEHFLKTHHGEHFAAHVERRRASLISRYREEDIFSLGFTFSFPVQQSGINRGTLMRWTKGFDIPDAVGKDVCALLQKELDLLKLPVRVAALVNDTVGTLMARSYTSPGKTGTLLGGIFGTGTNGAYVEKLRNITKIYKDGAFDANVDDSTGDMIVNTEWGSFDNHLNVLPSTSFDRDLDRESVNPGFQMFEKRISGMFLGEILRRAIVSLVNDKSVPLFSDEHSNENDVRSTTNILKHSSIFEQWGLDTSFLSIATGDHSAGLKVTRQTLDKEYGISAASAEDAEAVRLIASAIGKRAARLSAVAIAAVVIATDRLKAPADIASVGDVSAKAEATVNEDDIIDIGVDGSLVEFYPNFEDYIREALREVSQIGPEGEKRIRIGIAKDGSGVGAALIALVADQAMKNGSPRVESDGIWGYFESLFSAINNHVRIR